MSTDVIAGVKSSLLIVCLIVMPYIMKLVDNVFRHAFHSVQAVMRGREEGLVVQVLFVTVFIWVQRKVVDSNSETSASFDGDCLRLYSLNCEEQLFEA
jgi:hypothetical protein